jgi:hypothetical protein
LQLFDKKWDDERHGIFEPIPIKSDLESKGRLYDAHEDRPDADGDEDEEAKDETFDESEYVLLEEP